MKNIGTELENLWLKAGYTSLGQLCKATGVTVATLSRIKNNIQKPSAETLKKLAPALKQEHTFLLKLAGYIENDIQTADHNDLPPLTPRDERQIAKDLEAMLNDIDNKNGMANYNEPEDEEDRELLRASLEQSLRLATRMAKKKFTPKKYQK